MKIANIVSKIQVGTTSACPPPKSRAPERVAIQFAMSIAMMHKPDVRYAINLIDIDKFVVFIVSKSK
jgi:hypothetical protein